MIIFLLCMIIMSCVCVLSELLKVLEHLLCLYQPAALFVSACDIVHLSLYQPAARYMTLLWPSADT